jgi:hypothetical protein
MGSFDCVVVRNANDNFAQDDRLWGVFCVERLNAGASALRRSQAEIDAFNKARVILQ